MWIFLDIDGVLVPEKKFDAPVGKDDLLKFDPHCLQIFEDVLQRYPEVFVVISSSWREIFTFDSIQPLFSPSIVERVVGFTPFLDPKIIHQFQYLRHQEVLEFLRQNNALEDFWVAIDDIREHYPSDTNVVVTDAYTGFDLSSALALELFLLAA
ncbi:hypothetical protein BST81_11635 [Leptolyngbya sp. 'hensonii']|uniref:HAD domain-containing protein n=1 Tax=Leptolyngbya sp. 'hensonii' TaxID=1922337 RepID=UPI00094FE8FE|nr:HAD domain-containing protein [Leptolyngbya sp. 'hensonii']OLP18258.1 hypothetical protein BST81_11635 [Leptolyngbya sp. 'hensonii']